MKTVRLSLKVFIILTVVTGIGYPLIVTGLAQVLFPGRANGSIIIKDGQKVGSVLIGQPFYSEMYFSSRPSAVSCNPLPSGGSNLGLTNKRLKLRFEERRKRFIAENQLDSLVDIPSEMLFASSSGLDPHITPQAAFLQIDRIADARHFNEAQKLKLKQLVEHQTEHRQLFFLGEERINVLLLNLELDKIK